MNRRFEDVKINTKKVLKNPSNNVGVSELSANTRIYEPENVSQNNVSKYDFLDRKNKKKVNSHERFLGTPQLPQKEHVFNKKILLIFILALALGLIYLLSTVFLKANVTITAKTQSFDLKNQKISAGKLNLNNVPFELMIVSDIETKNVVLTNSKEASEKAKGQITLFNEYNSKAQKISANTFVSDEKGKTYKTDFVVTIPGYTEDASKKIIPGQVDVDITAFLAGDTYNGNPEYFTINAFKGNDKFKKIYGKAKTPISGGIVGLVYFLDDKEKANITTKTSSTQEKLFRKLSAQVPAGYVLYPNAMNFSYEFGENIVSKTPEASININGTLAAFILKESDLSKILINKLLPKLDDKERLEIVNPDLSQLSFDFVDSVQLINKDIQNFEFELSGSVLLNWKPDTETLKQLLVGKNKNEISSIFKQDPGITKADVKIMPFWSSELPKDIKNIKIILK